MKVLKRIKHIIIFISLITVIIGLVKVNIINTKALSPLGNSKENYEKIVESFGDDFSDFINDNADVKIYKDDDAEDILVRVGDENFKITKQSYLIDKIKDAGEYINNIYENFFDAVTE